MKKIYIYLMTLVILLGLGVSTIHATLIDLGGGMIYSTDLDVTWLQDASYAWTSGYDADGLMTYQEAVTWVEGLSYGGCSDWRLPSFDPENPDSRDGGTLEHEMGHLLYTELDNINRPYTKNYDPFVNVLRELPDGNLLEWYWSGTTGTMNDGALGAWRFSFQCG